MGRVVLVRHGQASLGSHDYDQLSARGVQQGQRLGAYWQQQGQRFHAVFRGTLKRHAGTLDAIRQTLAGLPAEQHHEGLNEYDSDALLRALQPHVVGAGNQARVAAADAAQVKAYFRLLRESLLQWIDGSISPAGMPSFPQFRDGVVGVLAQARQSAALGDVLVVTSGGPIGVAVAHVLGAPAPVAVALNMRMDNSAQVELVSTAAGLELMSFNSQPHLVNDSALATRI